MAKLPLILRPLAGLLLLLAIAAPAQVLAQLSDSSARVDVRATPERETVAAGDDLPVAVVFDHDEHWHIHTHAPNVPPELGSPEFYIATTVQIEVPEGSPLQPHPGFIQWPEPATITVAFTGNPVPYEVYEGEAVAYLPVTVAADTEPGDYTFDVRVTYQACDDSNCLRPVQGERHSVTVHVVESTSDEAAPAGQAGEGESSVDDVLTAALFADFDRGVWQRIHGGEAPPAPAEAPAVPMTLSALLGVLLLALVGGAMLNVMPCVLPVIPIKILGLVQAAPQRGRRLALGLVMALGVLSFWIVLGLVLALLARETAISALFGYWQFSLALGVVIVVLAVGMCGLFAVQLPRWVYRLNPRHDSYPGAFGFGVMTAVLATPCTGPFMGAAAGTAIATSAVIAFATFAAIGVGMALPYFLLTAWPQLIDRLPRTGPASEVVKQVLGLLMVAAGLFFIGVAINILRSDGTTSLYQWYWWLTAAVVVIAGLWLIVRTLQITRDLGRRVAFVMLGLVTIGASLGLAYDATRGSAIGWVYYTPDRLDAELAQGNVVLLDFTADWCINCKMLERTVLETRPVIRALAAADVTPVKVDLTSRTAAGWSLLAQHERVAIPLLVVLTPDGEAVFREEVYTPNQVVEALDRARDAAPALAQQ